MAAENSTTILEWQSSLAETFTGTSQRIIEYAPQLLGALVLLVVGWGVAHLLRLAMHKLVIGFDSMFKRAARTDSVKRDRIKRSYANITSEVVFWCVMIFFIAASANMLGWELFYSWMDNVIAYLPNLITGLLIILAGVLLSNSAKAAVVSIAHAAEMQQGELFSRIIQSAILLAMIMIGVRHIGIDVGLLEMLLGIAVAAVLLSAGLAFGLGAKTLIANIIGAQHVRKHCRVGETMRIGKTEGKVIEITQTSIVLEAGSERVVIPAKHFQEHICAFNTSEEDVD